MYRDDAFDVLYKTFGERRPTAKIEHTCCEHDAPKIAAGEKYVYIAGMWRDSIQQEGQFFKTVKICLGCEDDWGTILKIFHENVEDDACMVYGSLKEAVWDAYTSKYIQGDHFLIRKWHPETYRDFRRKEGPEEEIIWKEIEENAVQCGLQPALPGL